MCSERVRRHFPERGSQILTVSAEPDARNVLSNEKATEETGLGWSESRLLYTPDAPDE